MEEKRRRASRRTLYKRHITDHKPEQPKTPNPKRKKYQNLDNIANEAENKSKVRLWMEKRENIKVGKRPVYMDKLTRANYKKANEKRHYI